ncbi:hypothetical protein ZHAS_00007586 [Anopheles sinensis]|uniref:Uncharacterized protein n=1 Tax=Anopheles sinensis TaxID=74873 RepID=A0A084VQG7_ANOSI|nr:hypothetical protein ZHAS_00007586 [Anopheles sinensis]
MSYGQQQQQLPINRDEVSLDLSKMAFEEVAWLLQLSVKPSPRQTMDHLSLSPDITTSGVQPETALCPLCKTA